MGQQRQNSFRSAAAWTWTALVGVGSAVLFAVGLATGSIATDLNSVITAIGWMVLPALFTALGSLIATRRPGNRISWLLFAVAIAVLVDAVLTALYQDQPVSPAFWDYVAIEIWNLLWLGILFPLILLLFLFPTGRFHTRRWIWAGWVQAAMVAFVVFVGVLTEEIGPPTEEWVVTNPIGFLPATLNEGPFGVLWVLGLVALVIGGLTALVVRYRRSAQLVRTQIKWVLYAAAVFVAAFAFTAFANLFLNVDYLLGAMLAFSLALFPISITVAITRYRLFEIDRIVNRTLVYALVVAVLAGIYAAAVVLLRGLLPDGSDLAVAASTLAVAALFDPVRKQVQGFVDRRFYRSRYNAERTIEEFSARAGIEVDLDRLTAEWLSTVHQAVKPETATVWIRSRA